MCDVRPGRVLDTCLATRPEFCEPEIPARAVIRDGAFEMVGRNMK